MPISDQYVNDVDLDNEQDESKIAAKVNSEISGSRNYWSEFKDLCTELYFDFLAYKESIRDKTKSNTFVPLPYVDVRTNKARIKRIFTATRPYGTVKSVPYDPMLSFKLSHFASDELDATNYKRFLDIAVQDALIYPGAIFQTTWEKKYKNLPAFDIMGGMMGMPPIRMPRFDIETGERAFEMQEIRDGFCLTNIHIQDFYLPKNSKEAETDPWAAKVFSASITDLQNELKIDGSYKYYNLERLAGGGTKRGDSSEMQRQGAALKRDLPSVATYKESYDIIEFCTDNWIYYVPEGSDFLIGKEKNPYRKKPYHIARVELLNGEPYGFSPTRANHLMTRTFNEVIDIIMDQAYLEDNKCWIVNSDLVDDFEIGAIQGGIIHVNGLDGAIDVANAIKPVETRALASELLQLVNLFDTYRQLGAGRPNSSVGLPVQGAETAYENAQLAEGSTVSIVDMAENLVETMLRPIYEDLFHLAQIAFTGKKDISITDEQGEIKQILTIYPQEVYGDHNYEFDFLARYKNQIEERAAYANLLQVWGNVANVDEVSALLMRNLLINSGIPDMEAVDKALAAAIQQRRMMEMLMLQAKMGMGQNEQGNSPKTGQESVHDASSNTANRNNSMKPAGA